MSCHVSSGGHELRQQAGGAASQGADVLWQQAAVSTFKGAAQVTSDWAASRSHALHDNSMGCRSSAQAASRAHMCSQHADGRNAS